MRSDIDRYLERYRELVSAWIRNGVPDVAKRLRAVARDIERELWTIDKSHDKREALTLQLLALPRPRWTEPLTEGELAAALRRVDACPGDEPLSDAASMYGERDPSNVSSTLGRWASIEWHRRDPSYPASEAS